jgi:hypothetical protein
VREEEVMSSSVTMASAEQVQSEADKPPFPDTSTCHLGFRYIDPVFFSPLLTDCVGMRKTPIAVMLSVAKHLAFYEDEILGLSPKDDITT